MKKKRKVSERLTKIQIFCQHQVHDDTHRGTENFRTETHNIHRCTEGCCLLIIHYFVYGERLD